jgi:hypothetical protein
VCNDAKKNSKGAIVNELPRTALEEFWPMETVSLRCGGHIMVVWLLGSCSGAVWRGDTVAISSGDVEISKSR